jgi:hypothetical protein
MDVETEIADLKRRMGELEGAVNVLAGHIGKIHPDLLRLTGTAQKRFDTVDSMMHRVFDRLDTMNTQVWSLRDDLPDLVADAVTKSIPVKN